jgi:indolepyruvate ferredoxin oxidoreductase
VAAQPDVTLAAVSLDDRYRLDSGRVYLSGVQALVRLLLEQRRLDARAGLDTAGFASGYRGSPLGGLDLALWQAADELRRHRVHFEPGLNEELAATMVQGSQQVGLIGGARVGGVFGLWYAKNPGVDRAGDALKHANAAGTAALGGVLAVAGDDPGGTSSSVPNQCEPAFTAALMPTLAPASVGEIIELGLAGWAMSRFAGTWVGLKTVADVVESSASVQLQAREPFILPAGFWDASAPRGIRWPDSRWQQDERLQGVRLPAARAFAQANCLDRHVFGASRPRLGIVCAGKPLSDVRQALDLLGIDADAADALGVAVFQVGMVWPLEPTAVRRFTEGLDEVLVVEERRAVLEPQIKELAYHWPAARRPRVIGKTDEAGVPLLPETGVLSPALVARVIGERLLMRPCAPEDLRRRLGLLQLREADAAASGQELVRSPHFCAGCPHSSSTRVPEGGLAMAGIGCHSLRLGMPASQTMFMVQMGGEGSNWLGAAPFVERPHVFQNLGDGTYGHSGSLAVRAAIAAGARMTFRILYNGTVAMTGGQPAEGALEVGQIAGQLRAEGVQRVAVVAEDPSRHARGLPAGVTLHGKDELAQVQRELAAQPGVSVLIHDQLCAIEKRRRRRRGDLPAVTSWPFINERVCEGCGDCVDQSQCAALLPVDTPLGRKRRIDVSACNVELSCVGGLCPSFVSVVGDRLRQPPLAPAPAGTLPEPQHGRRADAQIVIHGIGGSGVVTVGAILGMAAHLEERGCSVLDNTGIARKGGAVSSHVRISADRAAPNGSRIGDGQATLVIAADLVAAAESVAVAKMASGRTRVLLNADAVPTLVQRLDPDAPFDAAALRQRLAAVVGAESITAIAATTLAQRLLGDAIFANMVLLGAAFQAGRVPLSLAAVERAIELNGQAVAANRNAFALGRAAVHRPHDVAEALAAATGRASDASTPDSLESLVADRCQRLRAYQGEALAERYRALVQRAREAEAMAGLATTAVAASVASAFYRLLAVKDEYEVARLYADGEFRAELDRWFAPGYSVRYHLAPPLLAGRGPDGRPRKHEYGSWMSAVWPWLARMRVLRGTWLDPFGYTAERRLERRLADEYEVTLLRLLERLTPARRPLVLEYAGLPDRVRGFGAVKQRTIAAFREQADRILGQLEATPTEGAT